VKLWSFAATRGRFTLQWMMTILNQLNRNGGKKLLSLLTLSSFSLGMYIPKVQITFYNVEIT
jgi:hypothetical protein